MKGLVLLATIVAIVPFVPHPYLALTGSEKNDAFISMIYSVVMLGLLVPQLRIITRPQKWWLPVATGLLAD